MCPLKEVVPIPMFPSTSVVTTLKIILSKISVLIMGSQFFINDITRQIPVQCGRWETITLRSLRGLVVMAWVMEYPGVIYPLPSLKAMFGLRGNVPILAQLNKS